MERFVCLFLILGLDPSGLLVIILQVFIVYSINGFISNPIHNEPGFENDNSIRNKNYNILITYENFNSAIYNILVNIPKDFEYFKSIIEKKFLENYEKIDKKIEDNLIYNNKVIDCSIYSMKDKINYINVRNNITILYNKLNKNN